MRQDLVGFINSTFAFFLRFLEGRAFILQEKELICTMSVHLPFFFFSLKMAFELKQTLLGKSPT